MTRLLYLDDSYLKTFQARVVEVGEEWVALDRTAFYPRGGGLPSDQGVLRWDAGEARVIDVRKSGEKVVHFLEGPVPEDGRVVEGVLDWERRYRVMRMHTGLHVLIAVFNKKAGVLVTGNQVGVERSRVDLNLEKPDSRLVEEAIAEANEVLARDLPVKIYYLRREEALRIPGIVKLAQAAPPNLEVLRIVEIPGVDIQADGGPHVARTGEVGKLVFLRLQNKGRNNRRIYFTLEP